MSPCRACDAPAPLCAHCGACADCCACGRGELLPPAGGPLAGLGGRDAELARLRAENSRLRAATGDAEEPATEAQLRYLAGLLPNVTKRDAQALIAYLKGWQGWSRRGQRAALLRLARLPQREALDCLPDLIR